MPTHISRRSLTFAVAGLLLATRFEHFGALPDASLAVFLIGGMLLGGALPFAALFALAFAVDLAAVEVESWRVYYMTPAYWGLLPTYGLLWLGGRSLARSPHPFAPARLMMAGVVLFAAAFVVSNLGWWALSYRFDLPLAAFCLAVAGYFPSYLGSGMLYLGLFALMVHVRPAWRVASLPAAG
jgi:hypothetical protein